jgi:hypothetical protein
VNQVSSLSAARALAAAIVVGAACVLGLLPAAAVAAGPPGGIVGPFGGGVIKAPSPPAQPGLYALQASPTAVIVGWYDRSTDEQKFVLYRRSASGAWQEIYEVPTRNVTGGGDYYYDDTDHSVSGQCYRIAAVNQNGSGFTSEECTVRPDPSVFPQSPPTAVKQWVGLSSVNDGTGDLQTTTRSQDTSLTWSNQTFGVDLNWSSPPALWKIEAQGGPQLMGGQAVALRVWGGGWLKYGHETWGVDLQLSDTPSYEWYLLAGTPGRPIDGSTFALWNSAANDYLVYGDETFGVNLNWYQKTLPQQNPPPPPPHGVKSYVIYNCTTEQRPVEMWVSDLSAGGGWVDEGRLDEQYAGSACPYAGQPFTFTPPVPGHEYEIEAVDYLAPGCSNEPNMSCERLIRTFVADPGGDVLSATIS